MRVGDDYLQQSAVKKVSIDNVSMFGKFETAVTR